MATASGHEGVVNYLLSTGENRELSQPATWVSSFENNGHVPFSLAATHGHIAVLELLLKKGAEIDQVDTMTGLSPLEFAVVNGHDPIVRFLLK